MAREDLDGLSEDDLPPDYDPGPPLPELVELREQPEGTFADRIRATIQGRMSVGDMLDFVVPTFLDFLREIGSMVFGGVTTSTSSPERDSDE